MYMGISYEEWQTFPWWLQRIYAEGLARTRPWIVYPQLSQEYNPLHPETGAFGLVYDPTAGLEDITEAGDEFGLNVVQVDFSGRNNT